MLRTLPQILKHSRDMETMLELIIKTGMFDITIQKEEGGREGGLR